MRPSFEEMVMALGISKKEIAKELGIGYTYLCSLCNGSRKLTYDLYNKFVNIFGSRLPPKQDLSSQALVANEAQEKYTTRSSENERILLQLEMLASGQNENNKLLQLILAHLTATSSVSQPAPRAEDIDPKA